MNVETMSTAQWYRLLLEQSITMEESKTIADIISRPDLRLLLLILTGNLAGVGQGSKVLDPRQLLSSGNSCIIFFQLKRDWHEFYLIYLLIASFVPPQP